MDFQERGWGGMEWIEVAQDRDQWMALANRIMNLRLHKMGNSQVVLQLAVSQEVSLLTVRIISMTKTASEVASEK
jgi:hypothetical protein